MKHILPFPSFGVFMMIACLVIDVTRDRIKKHVYLTPNAEDVQLSTPSLLMKNVQVPYGIFCLISVIVRINIIEVSE